MLLNKKKQAKNSRHNNKQSRRLNGRRDSLTYSQKKTLHKLIFSIILAAILWILFSPNFGILALIHKNKQRAELQNEIATLSQQNKQLQDDVANIENDTQFLEEEVRRRKYLRKNERVYDFSRKKKKE